MHDSKETQLGQEALLVGYSLQVSADKRVERPDLSDGLGLELQESRQWLASGLTNSSRCEKQLSALINPHRVMQGIGE